MEKNLTLVDHLSELRKRTLIVVIALIVLLIPMYILSSPVLERVFGYVAAQGYKLYIYDITDALTLKLRMTLLLDIAVCLPLILTQALGFVWSGLYKRERALLSGLLAAFGLLFLAGVAAFIVWLTPVALDWIYALRPEYGTILSARGYYDIWEGCALAAGLIATLPCLPLIIHQVRRLNAE